MSQPAEPPPAKLFVSILFQNRQPVDTPPVQDAISVLEKEYGPMDVQSPILPFDYTTYYQPEMGEPLWRRALSFERLVHRSQLIDIKWFCVSLEQKHFNPQGNRLVNIDPGLISAENFILATGKNFTHRVYLGKGIYADLTLIYTKKRFNPLPWTYPDYAAEDLSSQLVQMRLRLLETLKRHEGAPD